MLVRRESKEAWSSMYNENPKTLEEEGPKHPSKVDTLD